MLQLVGCHYCPTFVKPATGTDDHVACHHSKRERTIHPRASSRVVIHHSRLRAFHKWHKFIIIINLPFAQHFPIYYTCNIHRLSRECHLTIRSIFACSFRQFGLARHSPAVYASIIVLICHHFDCCNVNIEYIFCHDPVPLIPFQ